MPTFSVVTINFNNLEGLKRTFESVVEQTYSNYEYIIIDGGSTDGSREYLSFNSSKINFWVSEQDDGVYHAMNKGIRRSNSAYLIFLNSGDCFASPNVLLNVSNELDLNSDIIYGCHLWKKSGERWNPKIGYKFREIVHITPVSHQATFYKKSIFDGLGFFDEENKIISDWALFIKALLNKKKFQKVSLDICIAEEPGESNIDITSIQKERKKYLLKNHFFRYLIYTTIEFPIKQVKQYFLK